MDLRTRQPGGGRRGSRLKGRGEKIWIKKYWSSTVN